MSASMCVIQIELVQIKRVKLVKCFVGVMEGIKFNSSLVLYIYFYLF